MCYIIPFFNFMSADWLDIMTVSQSTALSVAEINFYFAGSMHLLPDAEVGSKLTYLVAKLVAT